MTQLQQRSTFQPGNLIRARGREWVVQSESRPDWLRLRPLGGSDDESIALIPELELLPIEAATFAPPVPERAGNHAAALLLRDALRLSLRAGAGPFRSFGNIAVEPRSYQLVPLLMALRLNTVRLLIADDVGIGKTIEAGLIARELLDRGEISRMAVLCPPHLVEQWQSELETRFNLQATALTAASAARLERELPQGTGLFDQHPVVVVSLDYIKTERNREHFLATAPEFIIVDEAHTCASQSTGKQLRFALLQRLAHDENRHLVLLTATPHSGNEAAFYNLLSLLDSRFLELQGAITANHPLRQTLARHFVQRRRKDIAEWQSETSDGRGLPRRMTAELTYTLTGAWGDFFDDVQDYCRELAEQASAAGSRGTALVWYATLALLRCVASSPAAAIKALSSRIEGYQADQDLLHDDRLHDGEADDLVGSDHEPPAAPDDQGRLQALIKTAKRLSGQKGDPKLAALTKHVQQLTEAGFHSVVFCRYIATAHYVAEHLRKQFPDIAIETITGEQPPEERRERVEGMAESEQRILVATDCLSEGINLQHLFTAVVHYDLSWNPTRHEQREGRVDRFGQPAPEVRCTMLYGQDNPVDGFVLKVILRKGQAIQKELGVLVPLPEDDASISQALVSAALIRRKSLQDNASTQMSFDFPVPEQLVAPLQSKWQDAMDKAKANRTVFAQRRIRPDEVLPEWRRQQEALGSSADVARFLHSACRRLGSPLDKTRHENQFRLSPQHFPPALRQRLDEENQAAARLIDLNELHRSHPLITLLAQHLLEDALDNEQPLASRCAVTLTEDVDTVTTLYLLRLRHQLSYVRRREPFQMMAEETLTLAARGRHQTEWLTGDQASRLLDCTPSGNLKTEVVHRELHLALQLLAQHTQVLEELAHERAQKLLEDHQRVRLAARDVGQYKVEPCLPMDVIGVYVLLPDSL